MTGKVVWYSHLFKNFPQFVVIHTVKGFGTLEPEKRESVSASTFHPSTFHVVMAPDAMILLLLLLFLLSFKLAFTLL